jgi:hypothetical protein
MSKIIDEAVDEWAFLPKALGVAGTPWRARE